MAAGGPRYERGESYVGGRQLTSTAGYRTQSGIKVLVINADITRVDVDGIVSSDTGRLERSGGVSRAIASAAGEALVRETQQYVQHKGPLAVGRVAVTTAGLLPCAKVLHTVGPRRADFKDTAGCGQSLADTVLNCLQVASDQSLTSLALPAISSGANGVPEEVCAESYATAVERFDRPLGATTLHSVMFVDTRDSMISAMTSAFARRLHAEDNVNTLRVALVGKVGAGKSALGNCLVGQGQVFTEKRAMASAVTQDSQRKIVPVDGLELQIVDTPGLFDPISTTAHREKIEKIKREIIKSLVLLAPGPHVILLVLSGYDRFTPAELSVYQEIMNLFQGANDYIIIVFTHTEDADLEELLDNPDEIFDKLLQDCGRRWAAIEKKSEHRQDQVTRLIQKMKQLKEANRGNHYTNDIMRRCYDQMVSTGRPLEEVKKAIIAGRSKELSRLYDHPETKSFLQRLLAKFKCTIL